MSGVFSGRVGFQIARVAMAGAAASMKATTSPYPSGIKLANYRPPPCAVLPVLSIHPFLLTKREPAFEECSTSSPIAARMALGRM